MTQAASTASAVFLLDEGRARLKRVQVAGRQGSVAWIGAGLEPGATVIVYLPSGVSDGSRVRVRRPGD